jgi:hypothetical protein
VGAARFDGVAFEPELALPAGRDRRWLKLRLPDGFADASCWFQATGGRRPSKPISAAPRCGCGIGSPSTGRSPRTSSRRGSAASQASTLHFPPVQEIISSARPIFQAGSSTPRSAAVCWKAGGRRRGPRRPPAPTHASTPLAHQRGGSRDSEGWGFSTVRSLVRRWCDHTVRRQRPRGLGRAARAYIRAVGTDWLMGRPGARLQGKGRSTAARGGRRSCRVCGDQVTRALVGSQR